MDSLVWETIKKMSVTSDLAELISEQLNVSILVGEIILSFLIFSIAIIAGWIAYYIFERYLTRLAKKTKTTLDDEILRNVKKPNGICLVTV